MLENYLNIEFLNKICKIAVNAGKAVMDIYKEDFKVDEKMPNHPITKADLNSHFIIQDSLKDLIPDTFFLSEESENIDWETRKNWKKYWLVDPLDGTKEFINKKKYQAHLENPKLNPPVNVSDFVDHIDYIKNLIGIDHVGISSDFDGGGGIEGWQDASETFNITLELLKRGYSENEISKI